jgi:hypothetical protein
MRRILLALVLLTACQATVPQGPGASDVSPLATDEIATTTLDSAPLPQAPVAEASPAPEGPPPAAEPQDSAPISPDPGASTPEDPAAPKSAEQTLCERTGGQWSVAGQSGAYSCVKSTRDGGKVCTKKGDCQGMCLARSGTCAPFMPLFGCNEILEKDGRRVTLCID